MTTATRRRLLSRRDPTYEKMREMHQETDRLIKEVAEMQKENDERQKERQREFDRQHKETERIVGKLGNRFGELVEHLVAPNISEKFNELGFHFTQIATGVKFADPETLKTAAEVDVYLENSDSVIAVEVKAKPNREDINDHIQRMQFLRRYADWKQDKRRYQGAIAGAIMGDDVRRYILHNGFYIIEQTGDTVQINVPDGFKAREW